MDSKQGLLIVLVAMLVAAPPVFAKVTCDITQITDASDASSGQPSLDEGSIAFSSSADLTGENPAGTSEIFLFDGSIITQITESTSTHSVGSDSPSLDGGSIAFLSNANLTGGNPGHRSQIFLFDGSAITQITDSTGGGFFGISLDGGSIAFDSSANLTGGNPDSNFEIFLFDGSITTQITDSNGCANHYPSLDGDAVAFGSNCDLTGANPDGNSEIFLFDGSSITQITINESSGCGSDAPSLDGGAIAFASGCDLTGDNPDGNAEIYLYDGSAITQITDGFGGNSVFPSLDGGWIAFFGSADLTGENPDNHEQIFLFDGSSITQVTNANGPVIALPSLDRHSIAFSTQADLTGNNPGGNSQIFLATCAPAPPPGPFLPSDAFPGFQIKVRITAGDSVISGEQGTECIGETLCVSGALPGRSELFFRLIGPRPNGFLWVNLVRFTPSNVEVWVEQTSTGAINYYELPALPPGDTELSGLVDKEAFLPQGAAVVAAPTVRVRSMGAPGVIPIRPDRAIRSSPSLVPGPEPLTFTSDAFPGYRFTVRIFSAGEEQSVQLEDDCIAETICVSGALPGRSELFVRIIGPRPNGFLWTNLVRFTTSKVEVDIEQLATGETRKYVLNEVPRQSDQLPGRVDRGAFLP